MRDARRCALQRAATDTAVREPFGPAQVRLREPAAKPGNGSWQEKPGNRGGLPMNGVIYLVGLIVVIMFILSFLGLR